MSDPATSRRGVFGHADERPYRRLVGDWVRLVLASVLVAVTAANPVFLHSVERTLDRFFASLPGVARRRLHGRPRGRVPLGHRAGGPRRARGAALPPRRRDRRGRTRRVVHRSVPRLRRRRPEREFGARLGVQQRSARPLPDGPARGARRGGPRRFTLPHPPRPSSRSARPARRGPRHHRARPRWRRRRWWVPSGSGGESPHCSTSHSDRRPVDRR